MKKLFLITLIMMSFAPAFAYATTATTPTQFCTNGTCTYTPLEPLPGQQSGTLNFAQYVGNIFKLSIVIGAMLAVAVLVFAGITYMVRDVAGQKSWAKDKIKKALWALLILLGSYLILTTINPNLVAFSFGSSVGGNGTAVTNPLQPTPFIAQVGQTTASTATPPSAAQVEAQEQACTAQSNGTTQYYVAGFTSNGSVNCQNAATSNWNGI